MAGGHPTLVIAGITRSGLTVTMQMLQAGGYPCAGEYPAFEPFDISRIPWSDCDGLAVKLVDAHLNLPPPGDYRVIRLVRDPKQQARSLNKFIGVVTGLPPVPVPVLVRSFKQDYKAIDRWASRHPTLRMRFEDIITDPAATSKRIAAFTGKQLDTQKMAEVVIARDPECYPTLLEAKML